jgi:outer membrane protein OmpA-like peptidoglycan-associated protein
LIVPNDNVEKFEIVVVGHTDSRAVDSYNNDLSAKRALVVANYLTNKGYVVTENYGVGEKYPVNKNSDEKERALNRRVEIFFRIYRKTYK